MATARRRSAPPTDQPLVLSGPPRSLRATLDVRNDGGRPVSPRAARVAGAKAPAAVAQLGGRVPAGRSGTVPVTVRVDAGTPPGSYPAELEVAGVARTVQLRVEADPELRVGPRRLLADRGTQRVEVRVQNTGNVPVPLARRLQARLWCDGVATGLDVALVLDQPVVVTPGAAVDVRGELVVPDDLDPTRRHEARVPVGVADLQVLVLPTDDGSDDS